MLMTTVIDIRFDLNLFISFQIECIFLTLNQICFDFADKEITSQVFIRYGTVSILTNYEFDVDKESTSFHGYKFEHRKPVPPYTTDIG